MKLRVAKTWNPIADSYQLTRQEIESQVLSDLSKYRQCYQERYGKSAPTPIDVDNFVYELWGFSVSFEIIPQDSEATEYTLGFLKPESRQIVVDESCVNQRRISFTVGHEAGHLSLHGPLFKIEKGVIVGWRDIPKSQNKKKLDTAHNRREWQANMYAGSLLAPETEVHKLLLELGLINDMVLSSFNLDQYYASFEQRFGLSQQALEIRLSHLEIPFQGARYRTV